MSRYQKSKDELTNCTNCGEATMDNLQSRNDDYCMKVCGSRLKHGYASIKPLCHCVPRTHIIPCDMEDKYERQKCYLENGYQYWEETCTETENIKETYKSGGITDYSIGGPGVHLNDDQYVGCDYTFPYDNNIKPLYDTPFRGQKNYVFNKEDGGYIKYDQLTNNILHISINPRQGGDKIGKIGIMRTPAVDPEFKAEPITNNDLKISIEDSTNFNDFSDSDKLLESKIDNKFIKISKNNFTLHFDLFECQYGYIRLVDPDFNNDVHKYYIFGLGPITLDKNYKDFSLNWYSSYRRCNQAFGTEEIFGINGSHWPVMYLMRYNRETNEQKCAMFFFDHFRKLEYFFDDLRNTGIMKIRTREPEFRFYACIEDTILNCRKQLMKILGSPQPPVQKIMGLWVGRFGYKNWDDLEEDIKSLREKNFPCDGFVFDLYWYGHKFPNDNLLDLNQNNYSNNFCHQPYASIPSNKLGIFEWDTKNFPEPEKHINELMSKYGYGITLIQEPYFTADSPDFSYTYVNGMVAKLENGSWAQPDGVWKNWIGLHAAMPDFTNPKTTDFWYETRIKPLITNGTFGWWNDLSEPEIYNENAIYQGVGQVNEKGEMMHEFKQAPDFLNFNQFLWTKGICENYNKKLNKRYNVCVRGGTCGIQRYGAYMWPGDENSNIYEMNSNMTSKQTLSLCGLDFTTTDSGGFQIDPEQNKVYSLWYANTIATSFSVKPHKWINKNEGVYSAAPSEFGDIQSNFSNTVLRYMLSPYYYSWAMSISKFGNNKGEPFVTTLFFKYQHMFEAKLLYDALETKNNNGAVLMVGPSLLYLLFIKYDEDEKETYFPNDTFWYNYRENYWFSGGKVVTTSYDNHIPCLIIKNNSIIPMRSQNELKDTKNMRYNDIIKDYDIYIYSYDGLSAEPFTIYVDDGISYSPNKQTRFTINYNNGIVNVSKNNSIYPTPNFNFILIDKNGTKNINSEKNIIYEGYTKLNEKGFGFKSNNLLIIFLSISMLFLFLFLLFYFFIYKKLIK
jgi:alpha-glucosidase (family GH31 glycosyl hydrolase)